MPQTSLPSAAYADSKPHYDILDGLRGVAALLVVVFHLCEAHATSHFDQLLNHGYLAVDFFFALSGFVIGYAYDDRWGRMTVGGFFKRRLIRLQPMVVLGMAVGAALFYFQDCDMWPVHAVPVWKMLAVMLVGMTLLPCRCRWTCAAGRRCTRSTGRGGRFSTNIAPIYSMPSSCGVFRNGCWGCWWPCRARR